MSTPDPQQTLLELEKRDLTPEGLWQAAQDANVALEAAELEYLDSESWLRDQRYRIERNETNITIRVAAEKVNPEDADSKYVFTNETQRKAEVARRLSEDPQHREAMAALVANEKAQAIRKIHIDRLSRDYSLARLKFEAITIGKRYEH